jgi:hypothetical protein
VAESGVRDAVDAARLATAGYQAVLVGETLVRAPDRTLAVKAMDGHPVGARSGAGPIPGPWVAGRKNGPWTAIRSVRRNLRVRWGRHGG